MTYKNFTSLPPEQEQTFVIYERTSQESGKKAMTMGAICGGVVGVIALLLFLSFDAAKNAHAVDPETDIREEAPVRKKAAPAPAPVEAPAEEAAAEPGAEAAEAVPAEAAVTAPPPPKGATKAPPTALIGQ